MASENPGRELKPRVKEEGAWEPRLNSPLLKFPCISQAVAFMTCLGFGGRSLKTEE